MYSLRYEELAKQIRVHAGATWSPRTGEHPIEGFAVGLSSYSKTYPWALGVMDLAATVRDFLRYVDVYSAVQRDGIYLGFWKDGGLLEVSLSRVCRCQSSAIALARDNKQRCIYNLLTGETIQV